MQFTKSSLKYDETIHKVLSLISNQVTKWLYQSGYVEN